MPLADWLHLLATTPPCWYWPAVATVCTATTGAIWRWL